MDFQILIFYCPAVSCNTKNTCQLKSSHYHRMAMWGHELLDEYQTDFRIIRCSECCVVCVCEISLCSVHNPTKRNPSVSGHVTSTPSPTFMYARRHVVQLSLQDKSGLVRFPAVAVLTIHTAYLPIFISFFYPSF